MTAGVLETEDDFRRFGAAQGVIASRLIIRHFIDHQTEASDAEIEAYGADFRAGFFDALKSDLLANCASPADADTCVAAAMIVHAATLVEVRAVFAAHPLPPMHDHRARRRRLRKLCEAIGQDIISVAPRGYRYWPPRRAA